MTTEEANEVFKKFSNGGLAKAFLANLPAEEYHKHTELLSKHMLDVFNSNPERYKYELDNEVVREDSPALRFGEAFHALVLEPDVFTEKFMKLPDTIKRRWGKEWEALKAKYPDREFMQADEWEKLEGMLKALKKNHTAKQLLFGKGGHNEMTALFRHPDVNDKACKARLDRVLIDQRIIIDLKTTMNASPKEFARQVANYRYDVQAAFYCDAMKYATSMEGFKFAIVAIEKEPPYSNVVYYLDDWMDLGRDTYMQDLSALSYAEANKEFEPLSSPDGKLPPPSKWVISERLGYDPTIQ